MSIISVFKQPIIINGHFSTRTPWRLTFIYSAIFVLFYSLFYFSVAFLKGFNPFDAATWIRFDSGHYIAIAMNGYEFFPCAGKFGFPENSKSWCGNTGWFPGYSMLVFFVSKTGVGFQTAAVVLSQIFLVAFSIVLTRILCFKTLDRNGLLLICISALWTGGVYYAAAFPISLLVFMIFIAIESFCRKQILICSLACLIASISYSTGFLLGFAISLWSFLIFENQKTRITNIFLFSLSSILGVVIYFGYLNYQFGVWNAFILVQEKYGHGLRMPFVSILHFILDFPLKGNVYNIIAYAQSIIEVVLFVLLSVFVWRKKKTLEGMVLIAYFIYTFYFVFPWAVGGDLSHYRAEALLISAVLLIKHTSLKFQRNLLIIQLVLAIYIGAGFFMRTLV